MGLLKKIDEVIATARYYQALSERYAAQLREKQFAAQASVVDATPAPTADERQPIAA